MSSAESNTFRVRLKEIFDLMRRVRELIARLEAASFPGAPHAASHSNAGSDEVDVTDLGGFPGGTTTFLRADGTFVAPGAGTPSATVAALDGTGAAGVSTDYSRGDHKHADANRPTNDQKAALVGTDGTPSAANPYVTDSDARLASTGITQLTGDVTAGPGAGSQAATIANNAVTNGKFRQSAALSVVGNSTNATANVADIAAGTDKQVLRRSGTGIGFGAVDLASSDAVTGTLPTANLTLAARTRALTFVIDGGGATITTGVKGDLSIPFDCTITGVRLLADQSGSIVIDIWKDAYANYPPVVGDAITASAKPTISSAAKSEDTTLTGWTTTITAGDTLRFNVDSVTTHQRVTVTLKVTVA